MRVLVTGGAGFIGHNVAIYLAHRGFDVTVYDTLERSSGDAVRMLRDAGIPIYRRDVREWHDLRGYDVVVHCAAYVDVTESFARPKEYFENNVIGTASIAKAASDAGAFFIYISSASVYGNPVKIPISEDHPLRPISPYGASKAMGEQVVELYSSIYGLKYVILRLFNVYGPGQNPAYAGVISRFIESAINRTPPRIYGDGSQTRDFIYVEDVARAIELSIVKQPHSQIFNIGSGKHISILELARLIMRLADIEGEPVFDEPRPGDIKHSCANIEKARKILGFEPQTTLEEGIKKLLDTYKRLKT